MLEFLVYAQGIAIIALGAVGWYLVSRLCGYILAVNTKVDAAHTKVDTAVKIYDENFLKLANEPTVVLSGEAMERLLEDREITEPVLLPVNSKGNKDVN